MPHTYEMLHPRVQRCSKYR